MGPPFSSGLSDPDRSDTLDPDLRWWSEGEGLGPGLATTYGTRRLRSSRGRGAWRPWRPSTRSHTTVRGGAINFAPTERLARKALGFYKATQEAPTGEKDEAPFGRRQDVDVQIELGERRPTCAEASETFIHQGGGREGEARDREGCEFAEGLCQFAKVSERRGPANSTGGE